MLKFRFMTDSTPTLPSPWGPVKNYFTKEGIPKCNARFQSEMKKVECWVTLAGMNDQ